uniref:holo-[acyl-carrier-protein] synthase n=1 Tax=Oryza barthii TaxID=65489 RepID=A0A0D3GXV9_9ORYZ
MPVPPPLPPRTPPPGVARPFASLPPPPPLQSRREVHVWYVCPDELNDHSHLDMYMELLSPSERKNALSMNGPRLQKDAMSRGRPVILLVVVIPSWPRILWRSDDSNMEWPLHFNISHTSSLIACGIAMDAPIGIDVEEKKRKTTKSILSLARRYFTTSEVDSLAKIADSDAQQKEFIKLWTLKEAYVKALGRGFSGAPFNRFSIQLKTNSRIQITKAPKVCNDSDSGDYLSENWRFALTELNSSYYMAVCIEDNSRGSENGSVPLGLKVWKTVPFIEDTLVSGTDAVKLIT